MGIFPFCKSFLLCALSFLLLKGVPCGPRFPLIRLQALATGPVSAAIANAGGIL